MEIAQEHDSRIQEIMSGMQCHRDFECYKSGFEKLGRIGIVGNAVKLVCLEEKANTCNYSLPFGYGYICKCPLRNYIARNFNRNYIEVS
ncbi:MAG: hypothetical protein GWN67_16085 [Phycisphaerae bacterium]|nr:hypothetical protein [Phycisphaerae bacterium]NIP53758.1 hypothetical protein [Phycisphaerae bacterium]NIS52702.1 hypothetical protein [Phycisphaerae bacterium]NIU10139.1 hypothetical protein [Phycisphaerae bacterium]NIU57851.1 hypothetical protein [Phycisphaerae bacterium]